MFIYGFLTALETGSLKFCFWVHIKPLLVARQMLEVVIMS